VILVSDPNSVTYRTAGDMLCFTGPIKTKVSKLLIYSDKMADI
jgi:hypothetical protein